MLSFDIIVLGDRHCHNGFIVLASAISCSGCIHGSVIYSTQWVVKLWMSRVFSLEIISMHFDDLGWIPYIYMIGTNNIETINFIADLFFKDYLS